MKRRVLLMALTVAVVALVVAAVPAFAQVATPPRAPQCGWYEAWAAGDSWWEYWCYWPSFGWEYVFWTY